MRRVKQTLNDEQTSRLKAAQRSLGRAHAELRDVARDLLNEGASIRELAAAAGVSTNTVQKRKRGR